MPFITITYPPKYPLTESEKVWLEERKQYIQQSSSETFCKYCYYVKEVPKGWACDADICPTDKRDNDYSDAAEFEALVAAKAVKLKADALPCYPNKLCPYKAQQIGSCHACYLRHARLLAEATMGRSGHND